MSKDKTDPRSEKEKRPAFKKSRISMHENVDITNDACCTCGAEPYWIEAMEEPSASNGNALPTNNKKE